MNQETKGKAQKVWGGAFLFVAGAALVAAVTVHWTFIFAVIILGFIGIVLLVDPMILAMPEDNPKK